MIYYSGDTRWYRVDIDNSKRPPILGFTHVDTSSVSDIYSINWNYFLFCISRSSALPRAVLWFGYRILKTAQIVYRITILMVYFKITKQNKKEMRFRISITVSNTKFYKLRNLQYDLWTEHFDNMINIVRITISSTAPKLVWDEYTIFLLNIASPCLI